jgi:hypothetical protein
MTIYHIQPDSLVPFSETSFSVGNIKERYDLQRLLKSQIEIISPGTLIISEEFGDFEGARRRIDLLGIDKSANLVVIELKRTEDGGHMELQAIRYSAMISTLTFNKAVDIYQEFLDKEGKDLSAEESLLSFLDWEEPNDEAFAQDVRIVLASADFSKELTSSVIWLNEHGLDIRCVRLKPYEFEGKMVIDVQQIIPIPEAQEYQVQIRDKINAEKVSRQQNRDLTKFTIRVGDEIYEHLPKRRAIWQVIKALVDHGISPEEISNVIDWKSRLFVWTDGELDEQEFFRKIEKTQIAEGIKPNPGLYLHKNDELLYGQGKSYALTKKWEARTEEAIKKLINKFPDFDIEFSKEY